MTPALPTPGALRETVSIERRGVSSPDGFGNEIASAWTTVITGLRAQMAPLKGGETVLAARLSGTSQYYAVLRQDSTSTTITTDDRLVWNGVAYDIQWVANLDERNRYLTFLVESGVAA